MARTLKLPSRNTAASFEDADVADVRITLLNPEFPKGEGVVIADATDTAPKARVRCRNMVKLLAEPQTITSDLIPDEFWEDEETLPEWIEEYRHEATEEDETGASEDFTFPGITVKSHTVEQDGAFFPLVSVKSIN